MSMFNGFYDSMYADKNTATNMLDQTVLVNYFMAIPANNYVENSDSMASFIYRFSYSGGYEIYTMCKENHTTPAHAAVALKEIAY